MEYLQAAINVAPLIVMIASAIATVTPTPIDNRIVTFLRDVLDVLALNVGNAAPAHKVLRKQHRGGDHE